MFFGGSRLSGREPGERQKLESSVKLLLLFAADSDGQLDESELQYIDAQFPDTERTVKARELLDVIHTGDLKRIEQAIRIMAAESRELRMSFLELAIAMCMADREVSITENHILRFFADALFLGNGVLRKRFEAISGQPLSEPGDPGSVDWWNRGQSSSGDAAGGIEPE